MSPEDRSAARVALFIAVLAGYLAPFDISAVNIALPSIGAEFSMDAVSLSWVSTAYLLSAALFLVPFGRIADIVGRKRVFVLGLSLFAGASFFMSLTVIPATIIPLRVVQGMGGALIYGTAVAILTAVTPHADRGKALGIYTTSVYMGLSLGPFLGGFMTAALGWRSIFLVNVPVGIIALWLIRTRLHGEWADARGEGFDAAGSVLYGLSLVAVMVGFTWLPALPGLLMIVLGGVLLAGFVLKERRVRHPVLDTALFTGNRVFALSNLAALINYAATFAVTFFLSFYLQSIRGYDPAMAGLILVTQPILQAIFSSPAGRLSDRVEPGKVASAGMGLCALGLLLLAFIRESTPLPYLLLALALLGVGFALFSSPNTNAVMSSVERRCYGVASGTLGTMRYIGQMLSMGIAMTLFSVYIGQVEIGPGNYPGLLTAIQTGFMIMTVLCVIGIFPSLARGKMREGEKAECRV
ncbi:MAG TPA: MFS transporter [Methanomicrobiales archaeon]|nr:MFS transporter [Methanomicrobiales archaeon]